MGNCWGYKTNLAEKNTGENIKTEAECRFYSNAWIQNWDITYLRIILGRNSQTKLLFLLINSILFSSKPGELNSGKTVRIKTGKYFAHSSEIHKRVGNEFPKNKQTNQLRPLKMFSKYHLIDRILPKHNYSKNDN